MPAQFTRVPCAKTAIIPALSVALTSPQGIEWLRVHQAFKQAVIVTRVARSREKCARVQAFAPLDWSSEETERDKCVTAQRGFKVRVRECITGNTRSTHAHKR